jgi:hypothetical protein
LFPQCPEACARARGQYIIPERHAGVVPLVLRSEGRATRPRGCALYAVGTPPLCTVGGATAPLEREHIPKVLHPCLGTPVGSLLIGVRRCGPVVIHDDPVAVRRKTLSVVVLLPKQDESIPRCLAGGKDRCVISHPLDAEASSCPPCCEKFRSGAEVSSCFVAPTPEVFATEAL